MAPGPRVFISYSYDSSEHKQWVIELSDCLRRDGIDSQIDQYEKGGPAKGWPRWMVDQIEQADFVLMICTQAYYNRFRGREVSEEGMGADWEGCIITNELYVTKRGRDLPRS